ncbi:GMC family oxidoreductase [Burkholderia lata]|uniref:GMC family oxidoreductase n=1 Tax=Burkholderia lata (strain ATCC 17760 / DSM 23089 / LMG 22485 / NCIMB 9086 / R18194 / 383) TaxID=482957 RepID=UPI0014533BC0|nr:GMC family oxidoreductase N-terminal domain-containing protein [Burkholderia lata]VWM19247.1 choline dehydrogenase [Burkholderia lata]
MEMYDYIVVGAGSAGCPVASRLSEDPQNRVLLIEAGGPADNFWIRSPAGMGRLFLEKRYNWSYFTEAGPQIHDRKIYWPRGRTMGGTSAVNGMVYIRGNPLDYERWKSLGNDGWGWEDVLPYFKRSESNARGASEHHGADGPLRVSDPVTRSPAIEDFIRAADSIGIPHIKDLNAPPYEGVDFQQHTIRDGRRETSFNAFIEPHLQRRNLTVLGNARVLRVVMQGNVATGIEILQNGERRIIEAAREIVISAGSLNSPHLLMLSGIGNGEKLQAKGIDTRVDLPGVGQNLQDHWFAPMIWKVTPGSSYNQRLSGLRKYVEGARYLLTRTGVLAISASQGAAFVRSSADLGQPDLQLVLRPLSYTFHPKGAVIVDRFPGLSAGVVLLNPASRGWVDLASPDPLEAPVFQPNYLAAPDDAIRTLRGVRRMREIMAARPMAERVVEEISPGPDATTDERLLEHLKTIGNCGWHQVGTCKMGVDAMAVVDPRLRVHGVQRLRVADGAIMPTINAGNTNAPCIMIGEKAAAMIREDALPRRETSGTHTR